MNELENINIIKSLAKTSYIGDDCAYIKDLGIVITQDSLVQHIHFELEYCTYEQLGYKSAAVNISDILASGAKPEYLTLSLSLPKTLPSSFVNEFTKGFLKGSYGAKLVGGDITGSEDSLFISVTAIGTTKGRKISSRANAKPGQVIVVSGEHGSSAAGLKELLNKGNNQDLIIAHLMPVLDIDFSEKISKNIEIEYAMMDTSDGLADALFKIAESSRVKISVDYNLVPHKEYVEKNDVLFGGEDYKLVAAVPYELAKAYNLRIIGNVLQKNDDYFLEINDKKYKSYSELAVYNHFGDKDA